MLYQRSNGRYYAQFDDATRWPRLKQVALGTSDRRDAERALVRLEDAVAEGRYDPWQAGRSTRSSVPHPAQRPSLDSCALNVQVAAFVTARAHLSPYTRAKYRSVLGLLADHVGAHRDVRSLSARDLQGFLDGGERKAVTRKTYATTLSPFFAWLVEGGVISANPVGQIALARVPSTAPRFLLPDDIDAICEAIEKRRSDPHVRKDNGIWLVPIVRANAYLGLRAGEVVNLRWEDVDLRRRRLRVANSETFLTKSGKERLLPLCTAVVDILRELPRRSVFVFPNSSGTQLHRQYLSRAFKQAARAAGLPNAHFHATRHTAASWLMMQGASIEAVRQYLGHSSVTVTERYAHLSEQAYARQITEALNAMCL